MMTWYSAPLHLFQALMGLVQILGVSVLVMGLVMGSLMWWLIQGALEIKLGMEEFHTQTWIWMSSSSGLQNRN